MNTMNTMNKVINGEVIECGICFDSLESKQINKCTELECNHLFHDHCLKSWCLECVKKGQKATCPYCRECISDKNLDILGIVVRGSLETFLLHNSIKLFQYIIQNKLHNDIEIMRGLVNEYPQEMRNVELMLVGHFMLNSTPYENLFT